MNKDIVLISTAEWYHPFWTNKQHTALALSRQGYRILYIDSLGLRKPSVNTRDLGRIFRRLLHGLRLPRQVHENIWICSPLVFPAARWGFLQRCNRTLLQMYLKTSEIYLRFRDPIVWTYNPLTMRLLDVNKYSKLVYHCVDDISAQPGMDARQILAWEKKLCKKANLIFVTSKNLLATRIQWNQRTYYFPNVIDPSYFLYPQHAGGAHVPLDLQKIPGPRLLFVGAISSYKVNFNLLEDLAIMRPSWSIVLIGAIGEGDPSTNVDTLTDLPNIYFLGPKEYSELPNYMAYCDVGLLPCLINQYTVNMFPMKFFEYLASGLPVISTSLPSLADYRSFYNECVTAQDFIEVVENILSGKIKTDSIALQDLISSHTYQSRTASMVAILDSSCES